jgi:glycosyltransferase involved in cell wall biosynthesis
MSISVVIPTYNRCNLLCRALDSVFQQNYSPLEIIVVDDGSTDETKDLIPQKYPQVTYLRQENQGVSAARNKGIKFAKGEWLAFLDSDDCWEKSKLLKQLEALKEQPEFAFCHSNEVWLRQGKVIKQKEKHRKTGGWVFQACLPFCVISPSTVMIHRKLFKEIGFFDENLLACEDYDLWLRITSRYPVLFLEENLTTKHGGHEDQLSMQHWGMDRFRIYALEKILLLETLKKNDKNLALETLIKKLDVFLKGAKKRGKTSIIQNLENKIAFYSDFFLNRSPSLQIYREEHAKIQSPTGL